MQMHRVRSNTILRAKRNDVVMRTKDGLLLVGELALPERRPPRATLLTLHPLPTAGGFMDSHVLRKASYRLPELADIAVLRFNTRGTASPRGTSEGVFGEGITEQFDLAAAVSFLEEQGLGTPWLLGWSFGTEVALKYGPDHDIAGAILLSPPLHRTSAEELARWNETDVPVVAFVPEHDDYLQPDAARARFSAVPRVRVVGVDDAVHLWVGERQVSRVLDEVVSTVTGVPTTLPSEVGEDRHAPVERVETGKGEHLTRGQA